MAVIVMGLSYCLLLNGINNAIAITAAAATATAIATVTATATATATTTTAGLLHQEDNK